MVCLRRRLENRSDDDREWQFFRYVLQMLISRNEFEVEIEDWMITSYDVEFGPRIGFGGLCVPNSDRYLLMFSIYAHRMLCSGEVYKGVWNKMQVAIKVVRTDSGLIPSPTVCRVNFILHKIMPTSYTREFVGRSR